MSSKNFVAGCASDSDGGDKKKVGAQKIKSDMQTNWKKQISLKAVISITFHKEKKSHY
jgi:hypothetical protein